jgi:hypothetical protein
VNGLAVAVDSNLLLLLVVGMTSKDYVDKHKRLKAFTVEDFDLLKEQLSVATEIVVTPNTLTETSNLIDHIADPARTRIYETLRSLVKSAGAAEIYVASADAVGNPELPRLGLTDSVLLDVCASGTPLMTVDLRLYLAAISRGDKALNFNHLRDAR